MLGYEPVEDLLLSLHTHLLRQLRHLALAVLLAPDNVELAAAAATLRVDIVAQASCGKRSPLVEKGRRDFSFEGVADVARAELCPLRRTLTLRVATLNHKIFDYTVEESAVEGSLLRKFDEVVPVDRGLIVKAYYYIAVSA